MKDYYSLLGIDNSATKADVKKNYRALATKYHPDKNSDPKAAEKFIVITEAYDILSNPKKRAKYDLFKYQQRQQQKAAAAEFTVVAPPRESTRTRRNREQKKRSMRYHKVASQPKKILQLALESLYVNYRYILHILGISLLLLILKEELSQLLDIQDLSIVRIGVVLILSGFISYGLFRILKNFFQSFKLDNQAFSVFYRISRKKTALIVVAGLVFVLLLYSLVLVRYF